MEVWRPVEDYPQYQVSNMGRVKGPRGVLQGGINCQTGYPYVHLRKDGKAYSPTIHRLVALAFIENPNNYPVIDHINRNRQDNRLENLRWASQSQNCVNKDLRGTNTGDPYISINKEGNYMISINREKKKYATCKSTLEKAIAWRDTILNSTAE